MRHVFGAVAVLAGLLAGAGLAAAAVAPPGAVLRQPPVLEGDAPAIAFEAVGRVGGAMTGVAVDGRRGVVSEGDHLVLLDLSDPLSPVPIGRGAALGGRARVAAFRDGVAYVLETVRRADSGSGAARDVVLHVVDTATPAALRRVGSLALGIPAIGDMTLLGGRGWLAAGPEGLIALDLADPAEPVRLGAIDVGGSAASVAIVGTRLVVARASQRDLEADGVVVLDAATGRPASTALALNWLPRMIVAIPGDRFALVGGDEALLVLDVMADPPAIVARSDEHIVLALAASATTAFVVGIREPSLDVRLEALSLGEVPALAPLGDQPFATAYGSPIGLAASGAGVLATVPNRGLFAHWLDPLGTLLEARRLSALGSPSGLVAAGRRIWAVDVDAELWPIDPLGLDGRGIEPAGLGSPLALGITAPPTAWCDCLMGDAALDPDPGGTRLLAAFHANRLGRGGVTEVDISSPASPRQGAVWTGVDDPIAAVDPDHPVVTGPVTSGERLLATPGLAWLAGEPLLTLVGFPPASASPALAGYFEGDAARNVAGLAVAAAPDARSAWVGTDVAGLWRLAPSAPGALAWRETARAPTEGAARDVLWHGDVLWVADDLAGLRVHDAADGRTLAVHSDIVAERLALAADGRTLLVTGVGQDDASGMKTHAVAAFDVAVPAAPVLLGQTVLNWRQEYTDYHPAPDVAALGDLLAVADGDLGVSLLRVRRRSDAAAVYVPVAER